MRTDEDRTVRDNETGALESEFVRKIEVRERGCALENECANKGMCCWQCNQIGRFIARWTTFQSLWQQLFCQNCPHFLAIFVKLSKSFILLEKSFLGNFYRHLETFYLSHWLLLCVCRERERVLAYKLVTMYKSGGPLEAR